MIHAFIIIFVLGPSPDITQSNQNLYTTVHPHYASSAWMESRQIKTNKDTLQKSNDEQLGSTLEIPTQDHFATEMFKNRWCNRLLITMHKIFN